MLKKKWFLLTALICCAQLQASDWPSFRGQNASGNGDGANLPESWSGESGENIRWRTPIPGLGHSSPIIFGNRIFITSATSKNPNPTMQGGSYNVYGDDNEMNEVFQFRVYCLDKNNGKILWERTAKKKKPSFQRHIMSSHANSTAATDGKVVLAFFGSEGLYCYDVEGTLMWKRDYGLLEAGYFKAKEIQWGFGNSPIIVKDKAVVLADVNGQSFLSVLDLKTGKDIWRTDRDDVPSWSTPTIATYKGRTQLIVNGFKHIGGYDLETGEEIWRMEGVCDIPVPTPIIAHDMAYITNAHGGPSPIYAVRLSAKGNISLAEGERKNEHVAWSHLRRGAYMPTPIVYGDYLYIGNDKGILNVFHAITGEQVYRKRLPGGRVTASAVAADGRIYFTDEEGDIHVIKAGPEYVHLATNSVDEVCMASPAIADGLLVVRTSKNLVGIGDTGGKRLVSAKSMKKKEVVEPVRTAATDIKVDPNDPVSIMTKVNAVAHAINTVSFDMVITGEGAMAAQVGSMQAKVIASGQTPAGPKKFRIEATLKPARGDAFKTTLCNTGEMFYALNHRDKLLHQDIEASVAGFLGDAQQAIVNEFHLDDPFQDEIKAKIDLRESKQIGGVDCWQVHLIFDGADAGSETLWFIGKKDFLPRARYNQYVMDGEQGMIKMELSNLTLAPKLSADTFQIKAPAGYKVTDQRPSR